MESLGNSLDFEYFYILMTPKCFMSIPGLSPEFTHTYSFISYNCRFPGLEMHIPG